MTSSPSPTSSTPSAPFDAAPPAPKTGGAIGTLVCRAVIPLWILAGAAFKLLERDPNLLPAPVKTTITRLHSMAGSGELHEFMNASMRSIIAVEFMLAGGMIFLPRLSRALALATLGFFIALLGWLIWTGQTKCGCFGAKGPSPMVMIVLDGALFLLAAFFAPSRRGGSILGFVALSIVGLAVAFGVPKKQVVLDAPPPEARAESETTAPSGAQTTTSAPQDGAPSTAAPPPAAWPPMPATPQGFYMPEFGKWVGKPLSNDPIMHVIQRPLPDGIDRGKWHVVIYRVDCDHCQELLNTHFAGTLQTKTLLIAIPDSAGEPLPLDVTDAVKTQFMRGANGPDYVIKPPVVITVVDGIVKAVCEDTDDEANLRRTLDAQ